MKSVRAPSFFKMFEELPIEVQERARNQFKKFKKNPNQPGLKFKHLKGNLYSVRINDQYRAVAVKKEDVYIWYWIGNHSEYDKLLKE
jgi:hypothetical protein